MFRVGILGAENSHAMAFSEIFNGLKPEFKDDFADIRVVAVGGHYPEANQAVAQKCGVEMIVERPEDMLGHIDALMVTARDGKFHAEFARPFIEAGIPAFIDKPFTSNPAEAVALARLAKEKGVPLVGGSSVKLSPDTLRLKALAAEKRDIICSADVTAPINLENEYGNFWFYASHLAETCLSVFGPDAQWVQANRTDRGVTAIVHYPDFDVTNHYTQGAYSYSGTLYTPEGTTYIPISLDNIYAYECGIFAKMLRTGEMHDSYEDLVRPVFYMAAIEKAFETGEKQPIESFSI